MLPAYQRQGIGELIIRTLEQDIYFQQAERIEIPASIAAVDFYRHMGYVFKKEHETVDDEQLYCLEKFFQKYPPKVVSPQQQEGAS